MAKTLLLLLLTRYSIVAVMFSCCEYGHSVGYSRFHSLSHSLNPIIHLLLLCDKRTTTGGIYGRILDRRHAGHYGPGPELGRRFVRQWCVQFEFVLFQLGGIHCILPQFHGLFEEYRGHGLDDGRNQARGWGTSLFPNVVVGMYSHELCRYDRIITNPY